MGFLEAMRNRANVRPFRREPTLVLRGEVGPAQIEAYVRQWCPDVLRRADGVLEISEGFDLLGPFGRGEDPRWPDDALPERYRAAYVTQPRENSDDWPHDSRYGLLNGLARQFAGQVRDRSGKPWRDLTDEPVAPLVQADRPISDEAALRLLASHGLRVESESREGFYFLQDAALVLIADLGSPCVYPLTRLRYSSTGQAPIVEYSFEYDSSHPEPEIQRQAATVATTLASAIGGILLTEDGFPWQ